MTFAVDISKFIDKAKGQEQVVVRKICLELFNKVILKSPVDTGRFRANWNAAINYPDNSVSNSLDKTGIGTIAKNNAIISNFNVNDSSIYLTNNLPYAQRLEYGYSKQAPQGMARLSVMEIASKYA